MVPTHVATVRSLRHTRSAPFQIVRCHWSKISRLGTYCLIINSTLYGPRQRFPGHQGSEGPSVWNKVRLAGRPIWAWNATYRSLAFSRGEGVGASLTTCFDVLSPTSRLRVIKQVRGKNGNDVGPYGAITIPPRSPMSTFRRSYFGVGEKRTLAR